MEHDKRIYPVWCYVPLSKEQWEIIRRIMKSLAEIDATIKAQKESGK